MPGWRGAKHTSAHQTAKWESLRWAARPGHSHVRLHHESAARVADDSPAPAWAESRVLPRMKWSGCCEHRSGKN